MGGPIKLGTLEEDRYDRSRKIPWLNLATVADTSVLVVGAGALGNEVGKDLALSGFRKIVIVDMDYVVRSNLNRCMFFTEDQAARRAKKCEVLAEGMRKLSPQTEPRPMYGRIEDFGEEVFRQCDVVLGCLDNIAARLHVNSVSYAAGKILIDGGMEGFVGRVLVTRPPHGACLQCGTNRTHAKVASLRFSCTGMGVVFHEPRLAAEITTTSVISAVMVREALKVASRRNDMLLSNAFYYDGQRNVSDEVEIPLDPDCPVHTRGA